MVKILQHACGSILQLIPDMIDAGVDILNPVQTIANNTDLVILKRELGRSLTIWGGGVGNP